MTKEKTEIKIISLGSDFNKLTVQKSQPLVYLWNSSLTLPEFKILDTYLSRIDSHKPEKRTVIFEKGELEKLLGVQKINHAELKKRIHNLMSPVEVPDDSERKGFKYVALFEEADAEQDKSGIWKVKLECTKKAMKYFFNIENLGYLRYKIKCITSISSRYSYIMFMYLETNRYRQTWEITVEDLKKILNCNKEDTYKEYKHFNNLILKKIKKELQEKINYEFEYTPVKSGKNVVAIQFSNINFNEYYLLNEKSIKEIADKQKNNEVKKEVKATELWEDALEPLGLTPVEVNAIREHLMVVPRNKLPQTPDLFGDIQLMRCHYIRIKVSEILKENEKKQIKNMCSYLTKLIKSDTEN